MSRWKEQTDAAPFEAGRMVFTGSSSIRFWEQLQEDLSPWAPIQRGFGGAISWNLVEYIDETIIRHDPAAVVIFVGTNDIAVDLGPTVVVRFLQVYRGDSRSGTRGRCLDSLHRNHTDAVALGSVE